MYSATLARFRRTLPLNFYDFYRNGLTIQLLNKRYSLIIITSPNVFNTIMNIFKRPSLSQFELMGRTKCFLTIFGGVPVKQITRTSIVL